MKSLVHHILLIGLALGSHRSVAQLQGLYFEHFTSENGLSQNSGYAIAQDKWGFLWMGTQEGLNRFDGYEFKAYHKGRGTAAPWFSQVNHLLTTKDGMVWVSTPNGLWVGDHRLTTFEKFSAVFHLPAVLDSINIVKLYEDSQRRIWIITQYDGLFRFERKSNKLTHYFEAVEESGRLSCMAEDPSGGLWLGSLHDVYRYQPAADSFQQITFAPVEARQNLRIRDMVFYDQYLWIGTAEHGIYLMDHQATKVTVMNIPGNKGPSIQKINAVYCLMKDSRNTLWIGTRNEGLYRYHAASGSLIQSKYIDQVPGSLRKDFVLSLFEDRQGIIWAGLSGGGFAKYDTYNSIFQSIRKEDRPQGSLEDNMLFCLYSNDDENLFIGSQNGGVVKWNTRTHQFQSYKEKNPRSPTHNTVYDITGDSNRLWLATWGGLCRLDLKTPHHNSRFVSYSVGSNNARTFLYTVHKMLRQPRLLVSGMMGLYQFDLDTEQWLPWVDQDSLLIRNRIIVRCTWEDDNGQIWMGTEGMGLLRYDIAGNRIIPIQLPVVHTRNIRQIHAGNDGILWLGTDNGLVQFNRQTNTMVNHWQTKDGLPNDVVYSILPDTQDRLWLSTNKGLSCFDVQLRRFYNYDISYGLQGMEFNTACSYRAQNGTLYFGGIDGLTWFHPASVPLNKFNPPPVIAGFNVMNTPYATDTSLLYQQQVKLSYQQNFFSIEFAALNFSHTNNTVYAYQLKGVDPDWVYCGNRHTASYTKLSPGDYQFLLKATNGNGNWQQGVSTLHITILPAFWQTGWFLAACCLGVGALIWWLVRKRIRHIRHEAALKHTIAETEMMALRAQMNPHFIFNCINSIDALIQSNDKYHATVYLNKFARLIRNILDSSRQNTVPLAKDLETLQLYIELEQLRNEHKFTAEIKADHHLLQDDYKVPPLIVQPYVENAILHGLRNRPGQDGKLSIHVEKLEDHIEYIIQDNGVGRHAAKNGTLKENQSYGMAMTRDRIKLFNKENEASVVITDLVSNNKPVGTKIQVFLKIQ